MLVCFECLYIVIHKKILLFHQVVYQINYVEEMMGNLKKIPEQADFSKILRNIMDFRFRMPFS